MTGSEIITKFRNMVDDQLDEDFEYELLHDAKDEIESMAVWEILKRKTTFTGLSVAIPSKMNSLLRISENDDYTQYQQIPIEDQDIYVDQSYTYYIDFQNNVIQLTDSQSTATKNVFYTIWSDDITADTSWVFPSNFHAAIPIKMAELYYLSDSGERGRSWDDKWGQQFERIMARMYSWNDRLKTKNRSGRMLHSNPRALDYRGSK